MNALKGLTLTEKVVWLFEHRVTEIHREAIQRLLEIDAEQFERVIPLVRDLGIERGLRITPVYEREGWWTADPTRRIAAKALHEAIKRNKGEAERNARVYHSFGGVGNAATFAEAALAGASSAMLTDLPELELDPEYDYVLTRLDMAILEGDAFVSR